MSPMQSLRWRPGSGHRSPRFQLAASAEEKPREGGVAPGCSFATSPSIAPVSQSPAGVSLLISRCFLRAAVVPAQSNRASTLPSSGPGVNAQREASGSGTPRTPSSSGRWRRCASTQPDPPREAWRSPSHAAGVSDRRELVGEAVGPAVGVTSAWRHRPPCRTHVVTTRVAFVRAPPVPREARDAGKRRPPPAAVVGERCDWKRGHRPTCRRRDRHPS
jgi:hypothetical protein